MDAVKRWRQEDLEGLAQHLVRGVAERLLHARLKIWIRCASSTEMMAISAMSRDLSQQGLCGLLGRLSPCLPIVWGRLHHLQYDTCCCCEYQLWAHLAVVTLTPAVNEADTRNMILSVPLIPERAFECTERRTRMAPHILIASTPTPAPRSVAPARGLSGSCPTQR